MTAVGLRVERVTCPAQSIDSRGQSAFVAASRVKQRLQGQIATMPGCWNTIEAYRPITDRQAKKVSLSTPATESNGDPPDNAG
ncbi:MAG: hypothetical protein N0C81_13245 [Candidatus Thiodiazotropha lotti]|nr:hypothetical protein [Candidatus Thiodiazotropha lotti]MCG7923108.1 hypothetical protein [Candidatus Thiodiazotropha lotti]MCG7930014.1 hypothetical protein [Candidatus Thiodiazotropha lotti]MCG7988894.1 hypothetical protein [Candidatus Thiodiazotropha lotti]MCG8002970.1 hypothetical protein [Candidatus Thiodiazotropha lotti]